MSARPHEAAALPELPDAITEQMADLVTAVNGFPYVADRLDAIVLTVRWLRANPAATAVLMAGGVA